jgi:D-alanine-D-alanine ligase
MDKKFGKIGVLAGGPSSEREISLRSGKAVYEALKELDSDVSLIDIAGDPKKVLHGLDIDIAFIALHGRFGEDGTVQKMLERSGIPYTGSDPRSSKLALDKLASKKVFKECRVPTPEYISINKKIKFGNLKEDFNLPLVVKPSREGSSIGLSIVRDKAVFGKALDLAFKYDETVLIEKFIKGRELTVGILDDEPLPVIEIVAKENVYDYGAKYLDNETVYVVPARITDRQRDSAQNAAVKAHTALGCKDFSRIDIRMDDNGGIFVLEVNTIPGLTERSLLPKAAKAAGINFRELCVKFLELALRKRER